MALIIFNNVINLNPSLIYFEKGLKSWYTLHGHNKITINNNWKQKVYIDV